MLMAKFRMASISKDQLTTRAACIVILLCAYSP